MKRSELLSDDLAMGSIFYITNDRAFTQSFLTSHSFRTIVLNLSSNWFHSETDSFTSKERSSDRQQILSLELVGTKAADGNKKSDGSGVRRRMKVSTFSSDQTCLYYMNNGPPDPHILTPEQAELPLTTRGSVTQFSQ